MYGYLQNVKVKYPAASYGAWPNLFFPPQGAGYLVCTPFRSALNVCRWHTAPLAAFAKYPRERGCLAHCSRE